MENPALVVQSKRGRPPKADRAMTPAERKRLERDRIKHESSAPEREELIKKIKKRIKTSEHANLAAMKRALSQFHDTLDSKSVDDLREIDKAYHTHDRTGRSSLEGHTGGKDIEKIAAAAQRDEDGRKPRTGMTAETFKDTPFSKMKAPPPTGVSKWDIPLDYVPPSGPSLQMWDCVKTFWDFIPEITESMFEGEETEFEAEFDPDLKPELTLRCRAAGCACRVATWFNARKHVEEMVKKSEAQAKFVVQLEEIVDNGTSGYDGALADARCLYRDKFWPHHAWAARKYEEFRDKA